MKRLIGLVIFAMSLWAICARLGLTSPPLPKGGPGGLIVHLKPMVSVVDPVITIGDVASLADGDAKQHHAVASLDLVELGVTETTQISREQISIRMQLAGLDPGTFRITGAERVQVLLDRSLSEASVVAAARQAIRRKLPAKDRASLKLLRPVTVPELVLKRNDHIYLSADWMGSAADEGPTEVEVSITINGRRQTSVPVLLDLGIRKAEPPAKSDIRTVALKTAPAPAPKNELPQATIVSRDRGAKLVDNPVVIRYRDGVKLVAYVGNVRVSAAGEALQEGRVGQMIRVRNVESQKVVLGRVREGGIVEIDF